MRLVPYMLQPVSTFQTSSPSVSDRHGRPSVRTAVTPDRGLARPSGRGSRAGFTLVELMVVVLIMGILAAIGISSYSSHLNSSKNTQARAAVRSIAAAQEAFKAQHQVYLDVSGTLTNYYPTLDPEDRRYQFYGQLPDGNPLMDNWYLLAPEMPALTFYTFATVAGLPGEPWPVVSASTAPTWPANNTEPWYVIQALGDVDGDNNNALIVATSLNETIYTENAGE